VKRLTAALTRRSRPRAIRTVSSSRIAAKNGCSRQLLAAVEPPLNSPIKQSGDTSPRNFRNLPQISTMRITGDTQTQKLRRIDNPPVKKRDRTAKMAVLRFPDWADQSYIVA